MGIWQAGPEMTEADVQSLVGSHRALLAFVQKRVGDRALAEDILQDAFVRGLSRADDVESVPAWFYRVLKNAVVDRARRAGAESRALAAFARELEGLHEAPRERSEVACQCVLDLGKTLEPSYRDILERVEVEGATLRQVAAELGITENNAAVRLHRARKALRRRVEESCGTCAEHGCRDCHCESPC